MTDKHLEKGRTVTIDDVISDLIKARKDGELQGLVTICQYVNDDDDIVNYGYYSTDSGTRVTTFSLMGGITQTLHNIAAGD